ncbi:hypothetical protein TRFO_40726 [Tritrichomonas foetus]|uniref:TPR Domain containing protein n=1 Tax=Tritrichomonas foetus TaxID=1144522 RepID=A0A1J4J655_9EUKA|nr:hypothetical protein TRFO_40726 [Tritrichomonas foetus]|eukprot:OHS92933.1 hypothetical protein TRFO_40726 [Tritrichomonas foetus]
MMEDLISPIIKNPNDPQYQVMYEFSSKLAEVYQQLESASSSSDNNILKEKIKSASDKVANGLFCNQSKSEIISLRSELLAKSDKDLSDCLKIGNISLYLGDFYTAYTFFAASLSHENELDCGQKYLISIVLIRYSLFQAAFELLEPVVDNLKEPFYSDAQFRLGIVCTKLNRYSEAIAAFSKAENKQIPWISETDNIVLQSHALFLMNDINEAINFIEKLKIATCEVLEQKGFMYLLSNDGRKNERGLILLSNEKSAQNSPYYYYLLARLFFKKGHINRAFESLNTAISKKDDEPLFWCALGNIYFRSTQLQEASLCYAKAMLFDKSMVEAWVNYGATLELDPYIGDPVKFYENAYAEGSIPIKREALKRKELVKNVKKALIPQIMEPNDREHFRAPGESLIMKYCNEIPIFESIDLMLNTLLLTKEAEIQIAEDNENTLKDDKDKHTENLTNSVKEEEEDEMKLNENKSDNDNNENENENEDGNNEEKSETEKSD